jgi:hypothetical protein
MAAIEIAIVVLLAELGLLVWVTFMPPFPLDVLVPVGKAPDSVPPFPLLFAPPIIVANVLCASGASVSAMASALTALGATDVRDAGIVARREVFSPEPALLVGMVVTTLLDFTGSPLLDDSGLFADSAGVAETSGAGDDDAV